MSRPRGRRSELELSRTMAALGMVGRSAAALSLLRWTARVSRLSDLPTLITGETGTRKELLARAIARLDPKRSRWPFVAVNCGAMSQAALRASCSDSSRIVQRRRPRSQGLIRSAQRGVLFPALSAALAVLLLQ
jgi:transcriptional regulator with AAA-type ATPase domain